MIEAKKAADLVEGKLAQWLEALVRMLPNFALAALTVILFWVLARALKALSNKILLRFFQSGTLQRLTVSLIYTATLLIGLFAALSILHLDKTVTSLLAGAGILGLALGFAFQDIASNFIAGILIAANRPYRVGELIETTSHLGVVQRIDLRTTELRSLQGVQVIIPNKEIFQSVLQNYTRNGTRRVDVVVGIALGSDLKKVQDVVVDAIKQIPSVLLDQEVEVFYQGFQDYRIDLEVRFWIQALGNKHYQRLRSEAVIAIKAAFDRNNITIPFPIRTIEVNGKMGERVPDKITGV